MCAYRPAMTKDFLPRYGCEYLIDLISTLAPPITSMRKKLERARSCSGVGDVSHVVQHNTMKKKLVLCFIDSRLQRVTKNSCCSQLSTHNSLPFTRATDQNSLTVWYIYTLYVLYIYYWHVVFDC